MCVLRPQCEHESLVVPLGTWSLVQCDWGGASQLGQRACWSLEPQLNLYKAKWDGGSKTPQRAGHPHKNGLLDGSKAVLNNRNRF